MIKALHIIVSPFNAWNKIAAEQRSAGSILFFSFLPLLMVCVGIQTYCLIRFGEGRAELGHLVKIPQPVAVRYGVAQICLFLICTLFGALSLQAVARSFNLAATFRQAMAVMAYGISPIVLTRLLDAVPAMNTWVCWGIGAMISLSVLYHGVALVLKPDQTKGFGLYLVSVMVVLASTGVAHLVTLAVLHEKVLALAPPGGSV